MPSEPFQLIAGYPALDFANTLDNRYSDDRRIDLLADYEDLLRFAQQAQLLDADEVALCKAEAAMPDQEVVLDSARNLREAIHGIFDSQATGAAIDPANLDLLSDWVRRAWLHRKLEPQRGSVVWDWEAVPGAAAAPVWRLALNAADLLTSPECRFVRECQEDSCRWLFLDLSKNHSRRWCDMRLCGNRSKARRHYRRRSTPA